MKLHNHTYCLFIIALLALVSQLNGRNVHREPDPDVAIVKANWIGTQNDHQVYTLKTYCFEKSVLFDMFDYDHVMNHLIPRGTVAFRNDPTHSVRGDELGRLLTKLIDDIKKNKVLRKNNEDFTILKSTNFLPQVPVGLVIVKFKKYPFVAKLYFETPRTFVRPESKDMQQRCLFYMAGGVSRYLVGFTRIKNLEYVQEQLRADPFWAINIDVPRKWFWLPNEPWFEVTAFNMGGQKEKHMIFPSVYAIIADAITAKRKFTLDKPEDKAIVLGLTTWFGEHVDPNISNYMIEKSTRKLVMIDTEDFTSSVGLRERLEYGDYFEWYMKLVRGFFNNVYFKTRQERLDRLNNKAKPIMPCCESKASIERKKTYHRQLIQARAAHHNT